VNPRGGARVNLGEGNRHREDAMNCPQGTASLGEGAKGCTSCGWAASKKTLWIVLGSILGVVFLACCGVGTWGFLRFKAAAEAIQDSSTPVVVYYHRVAVLNYARKRGSLPVTLAQAAEEPLQVEKHGGGAGSGEAVEGGEGGEGASGGEGGAGDPASGGEGSEKFTFKMQQNGQDVDGWQRPLRYTVLDETTYEVRSAGKDGVFDNEDDIVEAGSTADDLDAEMKELGRRGEQIGRDFLKALGVDPDRVGTRGSPGPVKVGEPVGGGEDAGGEGK